MLTWSDYRRISRTCKEQETNLWNIIVVFPFIEQPPERGTKVR